MSEKYQETKNLLEFLGFILNEEKCQLISSQVCNYLGFTFVSLNYQITLTDKQREKLLELSKRYKQKTCCKIREWAQFVGSLVAASPAIKYSLIYIKNFERYKYLGLLKSNGDYDKKLYLSDEIYADSSWWINKLPAANNSISLEKFKIEIFSDASLSGWGIFCNGRKSRGWWSDTEKKEHINFLELKAVYYGLLCIAKNLKSCSILLRIDNTTAISYINKLGSVQFPKLSKLSKEI